ncbi:glycosyltransferase family 9 protein [Roseateles sp. UC29_93]|uniref:glycosyltransferase family 9 protein n=1 Tax=Roseateles sp. UC29_93 TaxID=3350177 RepID=UPI00366C50E3
MTAAITSPIERSMEVSTDAAAAAVDAVIEPVIEAPILRVLVLRALVLGDLICAVPALRTLREAWPHAHIALIGLPAAREYASRLDCIDEWIPFPGWPGLPEHPPDLRELPAFLAAMQGGNWDLAIQLHGSGERTNPFLALLGARCNAGFHGPQAWVPARDAARFFPWPEVGHETQRLLSLCRHLGLPPTSEHLSFPLRDDDEQHLRQAWPGRDEVASYVCLHAGAQLPSRRWPVARFAAVGWALHEAGHTVVLTGTADEGPLVATLASRLAAFHVPCVNLAGQTSLWAFGALLRGARLLVCNDTGVSHVAAALRVPSVVTSCGGDAERWTPVDHVLHRVLSKPAPCRPCALSDCPYGHPCAEALTVAEVLVAIEDLLRQPRLATGPTIKEGHHAPTLAHPDVACPRQLPLQPHAGSA